MKRILLGLLLFVMSVGMVYAKVTYNVKLPLNGVTKANIKLQGDTLMPVYTAASIKVPSCNKLSITDTAILKQPHDLIKKGDKYVSGSWTELWTVKACGQNVYVPVEFVLDSEGTTYMIDNSKVHF